MKARDLITLAGALALAISADISLIGVVAHGSAWWAHVPGFFAVFGFVVCLALAFFAKGLGKYWLQRDERYYQSESPGDD